MIVLEYLAMSNLLSYIIDSSMQYYYEIILKKEVTQLHVSSNYRVSSV